LCGAAIEEKYRQECKARAAAETMMEKLKSVTRAELKRLKQENTRLQETAHQQSSHDVQVSNEVSMLRETVKVREPLLYNRKTF
jgi:hypothetical protein